MTVSVFMSTGCCWLVVLIVSSLAKRGIATEATKCLEAGLCLGADRISTSYLNAVKPRYLTLCHRLEWLHRTQEESINFINKGNQPATRTWTPRILGSQTHGIGIGIRLDGRLVEDGVGTL